MDQLPVIEGEAPGFRERLSERIRGRRLLLAGALALVQVIAVLIWRGSGLLLAVLALALLVAAVALAVRLRPGPLRDVLWIIAIAQAIVIVPPLIIGISFVAALLIGVLLVVGLIAAALRWRV